MPFEVDWDIDKYRDDHESEDHWQLRRSFMEKWKNNYPEERLVCLARVFTNVELLGCRYPSEVMLEISNLSQEVAQSYRKLKKTMLQRTFVSASDAAEDRAKGIKRKGGIIVDDEPKAKIQFVAAGNTDNSSELDKNEMETGNTASKDDTNCNPEVEELASAKNNSKKNTYNNYLDDMLKLNCINVRGFRENMFKSIFGRMVLLIRPWASKLSNMQASCQVCKVELNSVYEQLSCSITINGQLVAEGSGPTKAEAKSVAENKAWERITQEVISIVVKEQFIAENDTCITVEDVSSRKARDLDDQFGTPVETTVAMKMMQMMGWKGGGLGADSQGIAEPIKPKIQMVNRAGLGSTVSDIHQLRQAAFRLMKRFIASDTLDVDLVFSSEFSKEERALLHQCAQRVGLASKSYGDTDRFLVVKKKLDPFSLARAVIQKGGNTPKYQVFIPSKLASMNGSRY